MKTLLFSVLALIHTATLGAQIVKDPLLDYWLPFLNKNKVSSEIQIYEFSASFTEGARQFVFITDDLARLGPHGNYAWSVYRPVDSSNYLNIATADSFIDTGLNGPCYIGYIGEIKGYGADLTPEVGHFKSIV